MSKNIFICAILILSLSSSCKKTTTEQQNTIEIDRDTPVLPKAYNEVCFLMTHNAMNNTQKGFSIPNQTYSVTNQLKSGVRGLMLDTYDGSDGIALTYHVFASAGSQKLVDVLGEIRDFLFTHPAAVISIIFENGGSNTQLEKAIDSSGLNTLTYTYTGGTWPSLQTMVDNNQRLVLFVERDRQPRASYLMHAWSNIFDTEYTFQTTAEFNCTINRGGSGNKELYLINHWLSTGLGLPDKSLATQANSRAIVSSRMQECSSTNSHFPNYLGVDFFEIGDALAVVDSINGIR